MNSPLSKWFTKARLRPTNHRTGRDPATTAEDRPRLGAFRYATPWTGRVIRHGRGTVQLWHGGMSSRGDAVCACTGYQCSATSWGGGVLVCYTSERVLGYMQLQSWLASRQLADEASPSALCFIVTFRSQHSGTVDAAGAFMALWLEWFDSTQSRIGLCILQLASSSLPTCMILSILQHCSCCVQPEVKSLFGICPVGMHFLSTTQHP